MGVLLAGPALPASHSSPSPPHASDGGLVPHSSSSPSHASDGGQLTSQTALVGTVTDSSGSVVPGAVVVAVNVGTQDRYETTTNAQGQYNFQFIRTGKYEIRVTLSGFQTFQVTGIEVANNQVVRSDAALQIGDVTETLQVVAEAVVLDTDRATISETLNEHLISEVPLSGGRNVWALAGTTPGVLGGNNSFVGAGSARFKTA